MSFQTQITINLPEHIWTSLSKIAREHECSRSSVINAFLTCAKNRTTLTANPHEVFDTVQRRNHKKDFKVGSGDPNKKTQGTITVPIEIRQWILKQSEKKEMSASAIVRYYAKKAIK